VLASLQVLEQDLVGRATAGRDAGPEYARRSVEEWVAKTEKLVVNRYLNTAEQARHLLGRGDWELVNQVAPYPGADRYPDALLAPIKPSPVAVLPPDAVPATAVPAPARPGIASGLDLPGGLGTVSPRVLIIAGVGAVALNALGVPVLPAAVAGVGVGIGGSVYESRLRADQERKRAGKIDRQPFAAAEPDITQALRNQAKAVKDAVEERFTTLEAALDKVADQARQAAVTEEAGAPAGSASQLRSRLAALREQVALEQETTDRSASR
jgi:hypothetical protein